jgi:bacterioferritin-associated ferredoxin
LFATLFAKADPKTMYTCICNAITEREVRGAVSLGSVTLGDLKRDLGIATCCGKCEPDAQRILRECRAGCAARHASAAGD